MAIGMNRWSSPRLITGSIDKPTNCRCSTAGVKDLNTHNRDKPWDAAWNLVQVRGGRVAWPSGYKAGDRCQRRGKRITAWRVTLLRRHIIGRSDPSHLAPEPPFRRTPHGDLPLLRWPAEGHRAHHPAGSSPITAWCMRPLLPLTSNQTGLVVMWPFLPVIRCSSSLARSR
jgi:hypothetical protein